jgi:hypothetical protein
MPSKQLMLRLRMKAQFILAGLEAFLIRLLHAVLIPAVLVARLAHPEGAELFVVRTLSTATVARGPLPFHTTTAYGLPSLLASSLRAVGQLATLMRRRLLMTTPKPPPSPLDQRRRMARRSMRPMPSVQFQQTLALVL